MSYDLGSVLNAAPLPIAPETRQFVFVAGLEQSDELETNWTRWGGKSEFVYSGARREACGICIFRRGFLYHGRADVAAFLAAAAGEANVFEYRPEEKTFFRVSQHYFDKYYGNKID